MFDLKANEIFYPKECLTEWKSVIEKFGGKVVEGQELDHDKVTHVICPNRFSEHYKKALKNKKKICTVYWLEDVLQEQSLRAPG